MALFGGNPNGRNPFQQPDMMKSRQMNGSANPYGYGVERVLGQLAPQFNQTGMGGGTNSSPFAASTRHSWAGQATPTQYGSIQEMIDRGMDWDQMYRVLRNGNHGVPLSDYYAARAAGSGYVNPNQPNYGQPAYVRPVALDPYQSSGWVQRGGMSGQMVHPNATASGFTTNPNTGLGPGGGNVTPFNPAAPAKPPGMPSYTKGEAPPYAGVSPVGTNRKATGYGY